MLYSIIVPTYNERENLPILFYLIHKYMTEAKLDFEVVIVDDNSPDNTLEIAEKLKSSYAKGQVTIVSRPGKLGLGTAYLAGLEKSRGDRIILMDADLSHHPKFIPRMVECLETSGSNSSPRIDIVTGTRYAKGGGVAGWDLRRKIVSKGANILADFLLQPGVSDLTGSFRLFERKVLETILPRVTCKGYAFQMEIAVLAQKMGYRIAEVPISFVDRVYGESKLGGKEIVLYLKGLFTLFFTT